MGSREGEAVRAVWLRQWGPLSEASGLELNCSFVEESGALEDESGSLCCKELRVRASVEGTWGGSSGCEGRGGTWDIRQGGLAWSSCLWVRRGGTEARTRGLPLGDLVSV